VIVSSFWNLGDVSGKRGSELFCSMISKNWALKDDNSLIISSAISDEGLSKSFPTNQE
jgi:hypothetical protein